MGFRTSFYHYPKELLDNASLTAIEYDEDSDSTYIDWNLTSEDKKKYELLYDVFTNSVLSIENNSEYCTHIFNDTDLEYLYLRMNKIQFANFIKYILTNHVNYQRKHQITYDQYDKLKDELSNGYDYNKRVSKDYKDLDVIDKLIYNQHDFNMASSFFAADLTYIDEILNNPWKVSACWGTIQTITNLIHIYHMMDWDKEEILIIGC